MKFETNIHYFGQKKPVFVIVNKTKHEKKGFVFQGDIIF